MYFCTLHSITKRIEFMKQLSAIFKITLLLLLFAVPVFAQVQDVQPLPDDPRIKTGTLANGLTYYVIKNGAVKGYADFAMPTKVSSNSELLPIENVYFPLGTLNVFQQRGALVFPSQFLPISESDNSSKFFPVLLTLTLLSPEIGQMLE